MLRNRPPTKPPLFPPAPESDRGGRTLRTPLGRAVRRGAAAGALAAALLALGALPGDSAAQPEGRGAAPGATDAVPAAAQDTVIVETGGEEAADTLGREPVPAERVETDREAAEELRAILSRLDGMERVRAEVEAGVANLTGVVTSMEDRERASVLARDTEGIRYVNNRVRVEASLAARLAAGVQRIRMHLLEFVSVLPLLGVVLLLLLGAGLLARAAGRWDPLYDLFTPNPFVQNVLRQVVRAGILVAAVLTAVELLEVRTIVGAVVGTAGVAGLALGFAFKEIVENYLAGLILSVGQPFAPHDHLRIEDMEGKVVRLTSRETVLLTLEGNHLRIPNATILRSLLTNYTSNPLRRFEFDVSVGPDEDAGTVQEVVGAALGRMEGVLDDPAPAARLTELGESWVTFLVTGWLDQRRVDFLKVRSQALRRVKEALDDAGVSMPPPEYRVVLDRGERRAEGRPPGPVREEPSEDVDPDPTLDRQIEEDRRSSDEEDLLDE